MRKLRGLTIVETLIAAALISGVIFAASQATSSFKTRESKLNAVDTNLVDYQQVLGVLARDFAQASAVNAATANGFTLVGTGSTPVDIVYEIKLEPCPHFGAGSVCKVLSRKSGSSPSIQMISLADIKWCFPEAIPIGDCSFLPTGAQGFPAPQVQRRVLVEFSRFNGRRAGSNDKTLAVFLRWNSGRTSTAPPYKIWRVR